VFHETLGEWYKGKRAKMSSIVLRTQKKLEDDFLRDAQHFSQEDYDKYRLMVDGFAGMMNGYAEHYSKDRAEWNIRRESIEYEFKIDMGDFDFAGKIDLVNKLKKYDQVVEHKTASKISSSYIERLALDAQVRGYVFGCQRGLGIKTGHVLYDVVRKSQLRRKSGESVEDFSERVRVDYLTRPEFYFHREPLNYNKSDIDAFEYNLRKTHTEYKRLIAAPDEFGIKVDDPRSWEENDGACTNYFRLCEYHALCTQGLEKGNGLMFQQGDDMHEELNVEEGD